MKTKKKSLLLFFKKDLDSHEIQFAETKLIPPPNGIQKINIEETRSLKIKKQQLEDQSLKTQNK